MIDTTPPTALDFFRLGVFATLHGGHLPDVPRGVEDTYRRLAGATLVALEGSMNCDPEFDDDHLDIGDRPGVLRETYGRVWIPARITPQGQEVVDAMVAAARACLR